MAFFKKLKDRLFRSSSKLEEGLDAIVEDGGVQEAETEVDASVPDVAEIEEPESPPSEEPAAVEPSSDAPTMNAPVVEDTPHQPEEVEPEEVEPEEVELAEAEPAEIIPSEPIPPEDPEPKALEEPAKAPPQSDDKAGPGLIGRLMGRRAQAPVMRRTLDDDMLEQLEELLIASDMGVDTALRVTANLAEGRYGKKLSVAEIKQLLSDEISRIMEPVAKPFCAQIYDSG
ncbi:MAG: signal recognition particle receptor subunit alpha, partial [Paracoccaceae bacterium]